MEHVPYFAGRPPDGKGTPSQSPPLLSWTIVYALNLVVPLVLATGATSKSGRLGMAFAILLLLALGCPVVSRFRRIGAAVITGGYFVAVSQLFPLLQLFAGGYGVSAARDMGLATAPLGPIICESGGFVATVVTGGILIAVAIGIGWMVQGVSAWIEGSRVERKPVKNAKGIDLL